MGFDMQSQVYVDGESHAPAGGKEKYLLLGGHGPVSQVLVECRLLSICQKSFYSLSWDISRHRDYLRSKTTESSPQVPVSVSLAWDLPM